jgi:PKD domain
MGTTYRKDRARWCVPLIVLSSFVPGCQDSPSSPTAGLPKAPSADASAAAPVACFTTSPDPAVIDTGESISLDAGCSENVTSVTGFRWALGDGRTEGGRTIEVSYRRPGDYVIELSLVDGGMTSASTVTVTVTVHVRARLEACFTYQQVIDGTSPCTVEFDATCSSGDVREYRWFFEGGPFPPDSLPDVQTTTTEPGIRYSWAFDKECFAFRPFERTVRLTVVDGNGFTDTHEEVVRFGVPFLRR